MVSVRYRATALVGKVPFTLSAPEDAREDELTRIDPAPSMTARADFAAVPCTLSASTTPAENMSGEPLPAVAS